jgi:hypothetical protein
MDVKNLVREIKEQVSTYSLRLEMSASQAVVVFVEIHHLKAIELI